MKKNHSQASKKESSFGIPENGPKWDSLHPDPVDARLTQILQDIREDYFDWEDFDSPRDEFFPFASEESESDLFSERFFTDCRTISRRLFLTNPYAINAIENRINFVIGQGHHYHAIPKRKEDRSLAERVQREIDEFVIENEWPIRQQEIQRRKDRDGEVFLRFFRNSKGRVVQRFVEPRQVFTPPTVPKSPETSFGIRTDPQDVENVLGYWVDSVFVPASNIQHRKINVDFNFKRGIPILYPIRKNLIRAEKLLRNMSVVAEIQSAIALIRKHSGASSESIRQYLRDQTAPRPAFGGPYRQRFAPGTIIDASGGIDYEFPIAAIDASRYIQILQAELRAIASRLVMPEFMVSSDASNANYSSTMIAEGPAIRMFERLQAKMIQEDFSVLRRVISSAVLRGDLPANVDQFVMIQAIPPTLAVRDRLSEAKADEILLQNGVLSPQTAAMRYGLDPVRERRMRDEWGRFDKGTEEHPSETE